MARWHCIKTLFVFIFVCLFAVSCSTASPAVRTNIPDTSPVQETTAATATPEPTRQPPSPTPLQPLVVLIAPDGSDSELSAALQHLLSDAAREAGLRFRVLPEIPETQTNEKLALVARLPPDPGLAGLAASLPSTQFLAVGIPGLQPAGNLTILAAQGGRPDQQSFLAGYLAAVLTEDWRVGLITPKEGADAQAARAAFSTGIHFFCCLCRPSYPPFYEYPQVVELTLNATAAEQRAAADYMADHAVQTVYVFPGTGDETLLGYLANAGVNIIGGSIPPAGLEANWVATIQTDLLAAVGTLIPELLSGKSGESRELPLVIRDINPDLFSPGRQLLVEKMRADLQAGFIDTGMEVQTGEGQ